MNPSKLIAEYLEHALPDVLDSDDSLDERIAVDKLPTTWTNETNAIMVRTQTGHEHGTAGTSNRWTMALHCFGGTADIADAWATYKLAASVLRDCAWSGTEGELREATQVSATGYEEPDTGWPVVLALYEVQTAGD